MIQLNRTQLKIICMVAMTINHIGVFMSQKTQLNTLVTYGYKYIGMIVFPILLYLLVEGYKHTSNYKRYVSRIGFICILSIIPFHLMIPNQMNVMWTLFVCLIALETMKKNPILTFIIGYMCTIFSDWGLFAIPLLYLYIYTTREIAFATLLSVQILPALLTMNALETYAPLGIILASYLLMWYNNKEITKHKWINYMFYWYYPVHLIIIWYITSKM